MTDSLPSPQESRESWLNGNMRVDDVVTVGNADCCAGCGVHLGCFSISLGSHTSTEPSEWPNFPFNQADCPLCRFRNYPNNNLSAKSLLQRLSEFKAAKVKREAEPPKQQQVREILGICRHCGQFTPDGATDCGRCYPQR